MNSHPKINGNYGIAPGIARVQYGVAGLLGLLPLFFLSLGFFDPSCFAIGLLLGLIQGPFITFLIWNARRQKVTFSKLGITLNNVIGRELKLPWDEIEYFDSTVGHEGFVLRTPLQAPAALRLADTAGIRFQGNSMYTPNEESHLAACRWIPMRSFAGWLRQGVMLQDWDQVAPRLAQQYRAEQGERTKQREKTRDTLVVVTVISAMLIIPTIAIAASGTELPPDVAAKLTDFFFVFDAVLKCSLGLILGVTGLLNVKASIACFGKRRFATGILWGTAAIFQALLALVSVTAGLGIN